MVESESLIASVEWCNISYQDFKSHPELTLQLVLFKKGILIYQCEDYLRKPVDFWLLKTWAHSLLELTLELLSPKIVLQSTICEGYSKLYVISSDKIYRTTVVIGKFFWYLNQYKEYDEKR